MTQKQDEKPHVAHGKRDRLHPILRPVLDFLASTRVHHRYRRWLRL
jgi:hypothetical protein